MMCIVKIMWVVYSHALFTFQFCFVFHMEKGHSTVTKGVKMAMLYG